MRDYVSTPGCRMEFLRAQLDDEGAEPCGRCDNCAGPWIDAGVSAEALTGAEKELDRPGTEIEPRRMWPTGMAALGIDLKGRIPAGEQGATGRALGRLSDIGWGNRLRPLLAPHTPDAPVPDDVLRAAVGVLADWARSPGGWAAGGPDAPARPVGVVAVPSTSRPLLVDSLARGIATVGRLPYLGTLAYADPDGGHAVRRSNSAQRLATLTGTFTVSGDLAAALAGNPGPVLLVDDYTDSGWTLAVAARLLRRAGAEAVLPLVLAASG
jgi:ATP-dependent DNA helicase RecQ